MWGRNDYYEMGIWSGEQKITPFPVYLEGIVYNRKIVQASAGSAHALVLSGTYGIH